MGGSWLASGRSFSAGMLWGGYLATGCPKSDKKKAVFFREFLIGGVSWLICGDDLVLWVYPKSD